jgi:hypothetical protein
MVSLALVVGGLQKVLWITMLLVNICSMLGFSVSVAARMKVCLFGVLGISPFDPLGFGAKHQQVLIILF